VPTLFFIGPAGQEQRMVLAFQKAALNELAAAIAGRIATRAVVVAPQDDPIPPSKPG